MLRVMIPRGERAWFDAVALSAYKECPAQDQEDRRRYPRRRQRFQCSLYILTCPPSTQCLQPELVWSIYRSQTIQVPSSTQPTPSSFRFCASILPMPTPHHFIPVPLPTSDSRMGPQLGRSQEEIAFLWGRRESPTFWTSDDESPLAFHCSIFDFRGEAIKLFILKRNGFPLAKVGGSSSASPVNNGVPIFTSLPQPFKNSRARPTLYLIQAILSRSFVTHPFVLQSQAHEQKKHRASVPRLLAIHTAVRSCARS